MEHPPPLFLMTPVTSGGLYQGAAFSRAIPRFEPENAPIGRNCPQMLDPRCSPRLAPQNLSIVDTER
jgi:hypothetical protein